MGLLYGASVQEFPSQVYKELTRSWWVKILTWMGWIWSLIQDGDDGGFNPWIVVEAWGGGVDLGVGGWRWSPCDEALVGFLKSWDGSLKLGFWVEEEGILEELSCWSGREKGWFANEKDYIGWGFCKGDWNRINARGLCVKGEGWGVPRVATWPAMGERENEWG